MKKFREILFLLCIKRVGVVTVNNKYIPILNKFQDFNQFVNILRDTYDDEKLQDALKKYENTLNQITDDIEIITILDDEYPSRLKDLKNRAPLILFVKGNAELLSKPNIAVIGTRKPSDIAEKFEKEFVSKIIEKTGRVILSGLALGCDEIAHTTTVEASAPTIAFLPSGVNKIVPGSNKPLAKAILETNGCLVSTFFPDVVPFKQSYVIRDEYVAALSDCVFDVQCSKSSGTMHTINYAEETMRKIACYLPEDTGDFDFTGNEMILENEKYKAFRLGSLDDFDEFLEFLNDKKATTGQTTLF